MTSNTTYKLIIVALVIVALVVGFQIYVHLFGGTSSSPFVEQAAEEGRSIVALGSQEAYQEGSELMREGSFSEARKKFLDLAENTDDPVAQMHARFQAADALLESGNGDVIGTIQELKAILADPAYEGVGNTVKLAIGTRIASIYINNPDQTTFNEVFYEEPDIFSTLVAPEDALPNQADASLVNLHTFLSVEYGIDAENELEIANALFNHNIELYLKLFNACGAEPDIALNGCSPDIETLLTPDEQQLYKDIEVELEERLERVEVALELLQQRSAYVSIARTLNRQTRVMHKAMYFGFTQPDEVERVAVESIDYAELAESPEGIFITNVEYAIFLSLLYPDPDSERRAQVDAILAEIYEPNGNLRYFIDMHLSNLDSVYNLIENGEYSIQNEMYMRGQLALAMTSPGYRRFLENEAGWDFEGAAIQTIMGNAN